VTARRPATGIQLPIALASIDAATTTRIEHHLGLAAIATSPALAAAARARAAAAALAAINQVPQPRRHRHRRSHRP
jgi:hypothetical protein